MKSIFSLKKLNIKLPPLEKWTKDMRDETRPRRCRAWMYILIYLQLAEDTRAFVRFCYYTNWSQYREPPGRFLPEDVDPSLCTHIVFAYADLRDVAIVTTEYNDEEMYRRLMQAKTANPNLKIELCLGGWLAGVDEFSSLVSSEHRMLAFANNTIEYLRRYGFDGLDIDWEYPADRQRGSSRADRAGLQDFFRYVLRRAFEDEARSTRQPRLLLTAAVAAEIESSRGYYQISQIGNFLDYANLMTYDFHGLWDQEDGVSHHTALYPDVHVSVQGWLREGFPPEKLVLGTAAFARTFTLTTQPRGTGVGQRARESGIPGNFSDTEGFLTFQEICRLMRHGGWQRIWLEEQQAPAAFGNLTGELWGWAGFDDPQSLIVKAGYIRQNGLAGAMLWAMTNDDFNDQCGFGAWPLLSTLWEQLPDDSIGVSGVPPTFATVATRPTTTTLVTIPSDTTQWRSFPPESPREGMTTVRPATQTDFTPSISLSPAMATPESGPGYRQCSISDTFGPTLHCSSHHGKPGDRNTFYLYCFNGFFAIECSCLQGFFYNRCIKSCDADSNFLSCPFRY